MTLSDYSVIVYDEDGKIVRESFGRTLSNLEIAMCDALDKAHARLHADYRILRTPRQPRTMGHG